MTTPGSLMNLGVDLTVAEYDALIFALDNAPAVASAVGTSPEALEAAFAARAELREKLVGLRARADVMEACDAIASMPHTGVMASRAALRRAAGFKEGDGAMRESEPPSPDHVKVEKT